MAYLITDTPFTYVLARKSREFVVEREIPVKDGTFVVYEKPEGA